MFAFNDSHFQTKIIFLIYIIKSDVCLFVCGHSDVRLTSPPVLKLWGTQGYLWLSYDLTEVIKLIGETLGPKKYIMSMCSSEHNTQKVSF